MMLRIRSGRRRAICAAVIGLLCSAASHATTTAFANPFPGGGGQSQTYVAAFTASATGTLQAYFTGSGTTGFADTVGIYTGAAPDLASSLSSVTWSGVNNQHSTFGQTLFGSGIHVTQGQTYYFVEQADVGGTTQISQNGCASTPASSYYVWSNESSSCAGGISYSNPVPSGYNAMAYAQAYNTNGATLTGGGGTGGMAAGTIAAGSYVYVGFNDFLYNGSNGYGDFTFLTSITCTPGTTGCGSSGTQGVPEPGSLALAALGLVGAAGISRRRRAAGSASA